MENFRLYLPISKVDKENRLVSGFATSEDIDQSQEIVDYGASKRAFQDWKGNIREMHQAKAVGKAVEIIPDDTTKRVHVTAYVSKGAQDTWEKVLDGTLQGFSIGGSVLDKKVEINKATGKTVKRITDYRLSELSLVDNPCNLACGIQILKSADNGQLEYTEVVTGHDDTEKDTPASLAVSEVPNITKTQEERSETDMPTPEELQKTAPDKIQEAEELTKGRFTTIEDRLGKLETMITEMVKAKAKPVETSTETATETASETKKADAVPAVDEAVAGTEGLQNSTGEAAKPKNTNMKPVKGEVTGAGVEKAAKTETSTETATETATDKPKTEKAAKVETSTETATATETKETKKAVTVEDLQKSVEPLAKLQADFEDLQKKFEAFLGEPLPRKTAKVIEKSYAADTTEKEREAEVAATTAKSEPTPMTEQIQKLASKRRSGASMSPEENFILDKELSKMLDAKFGKNS